MNECVPIILYCDGEIDCSDGNDEKNCTSINYHNNKTSHSVIETLHCEYPNRYCDNSTKCLLIDHVCDGHYDCIDESDEGLRCGDALCDESFECSHNCHNTPEG